MEMMLQPSWFEICISLLFTLIAGAALGLDRSSRGQAAGFRTTILVGLAACVSMIQVNILLTLSGKSSSSFIVMDLMRLPLGILTGVGFIGGGCILKKGELITGVTTAATLWIITVIGLCFGGGQWALGWLAALLAFFTLGILKWLDLRFPRRHRAKVVIKSNQLITPVDLNKILIPEGYEARLERQRIEDEDQYAKFEIHWQQSEKNFRPSDLLQLLQKSYNVIIFDLTSEQTDVTQ